jgi:two-component system alkaline phosphatase synthesis response regulator PhoP
LAKIATLSPELVLLDLRLPSVGGLEVLRIVSAGSRPAPAVIALTGLGDEADRVVGLELGADDYIVKPFSLRELVARVRSVLRRATATPPSSVLEFGDLRVDMASREVSLRGERVDLRRREFDLLAFLCASPRRVLTRDQLLLNVWHSAPDWQSAATVSEHVHRLRSRIEDDPTRPRRIVTVRGVGYRFEP